MYIILNPANSTVVKEIASKSNFKLILGPEMNFERRTIYIEEVKKFNKKCKATPTR